MGFTLMWQLQILQELVWSITA